MEKCSLCQDGVTDTEPLVIVGISIFVCDTCAIKWIDRLKARIAKKEEENK